MMLLPRSAPAPPSPQCAPLNATTAKSGVRSVSSAAPVAGVPSPATALTLLRRKRLLAEVNSSDRDQDGDATADADADVDADARSTPPKPPRLFLLLPPSSSDQAVLGGSSSSRAHLSTGQIRGGDMNIEKCEDENAGIFLVGLGITEVAGEAGSGKTQICLGLCVSAAISTYGESSPSYQRRRRRRRSGPNGPGRSSGDRNGIGSEGMGASPSEEGFSRSDEGRGDQRRCAGDGVGKVCARRNPYLHPSPLSSPGASSFYSGRARARPSSGVDNDSDGPVALPRSPLVAALTSPSPRLDRDRDSDKEGEESYGCGEEGQRPGCLRHHRALYVTMGEGTSRAQLGHRLGQMAREAAGRSIRRRRRQQEELQRWRNRDAPVPVAKAKALPMPSVEVEARELLSRITILALRNEEEFAHFVDEALPSLLEEGERGLETSSLLLPSRCNGGQKTDNFGKGSAEEEGGRSGRIGIVALDSVAGLFRIPDDSCGGGGGAGGCGGGNRSFYARRSGALFRAAAALKRLSEKHAVPIVATNQVSASISSASSSSASASALLPSEVLPALGVGWSNCINERYAVHRAGSGDDSIPQRRRGRILRVALSPRSPRGASADFCIEAAGATVLAAAGTGAATTTGRVTATSLSGAQEE